MKDPEQEQMEERAAALWRRFHFPLILFVLMVLTGIVGFTYTSGEKERARIAAGEALFGVRAAVEDGDLQTARALFESMGAGDFASVRHLAAFEFAKLLVDEDQADEAAKLLEEVAAKDEDEGVRQMARLRLSEIYINEGKTTEAAKLLEENMPSSDRMRILFLERIGDAAFAAGNAEGALSAYQDAAEAASEFYPSYLTILRIKISALLSQEIPEISGREESEEGDGDS